jgi:hypothetical protein
MPGVRRNEPGLLVSNESMRLILTTLNLCLTLLLGVAVCVAQEVNSQVAQKRSAVIGFKCPDRELNQERPETKLNLGEVTEKALELPQPEYRRWSRGSRISGIAQAEVVIDINTGRVVWARLLNGHSLLQLTVGDVVCRARFAPTNDVNGRVGGIITYRARRQKVEVTEHRAQTKVQELALGFVEVVKERRADELRRWLIDALCSGIPEFVSFANGLTADLRAVRAALEYEWSQGRVEGQAHRLKPVKRQKYGRGKLDLLRPYICRLMAMRNQPGENHPDSTKYAEDPICKVHPRF